jgi:DNA-binding XRE family transcriptional regulator
VSGTFFLTVFLGGSPCPATNCRERPTMAEIKYQPVPHDHDAFLKNARKRRGFQAAYQALAVEYAVASEMLAARSRAGLTQEAVAARMGTTKSTISRLESAGKHAPSLTSLKKYAEAVGCKIQFKLVPQR